MAELSQQNKNVLIDAVVHAVNSDYESMANDFIKLVRPCLYAHVDCTSSLAWGRQRLLTPATHACNAPS